MRRCVVFALTVFALNFVWEMAQGGLFAYMKQLSFAQATLRCLLAAFGDLVILTIAFGITAMISRRWNWPVRGGFTVTSAIFVATGLMITVLYERWAIDSGRWSYDLRMPTIFGVGLSPLLQWVIVPLIGLAIYRRLWSISCRSHRRSGLRA
jgi:hypothetical protein